MAASTSIPDELAGTDAMSDVQHESDIVAVGTPVIEEPTESAGTSTSPASNTIRSRGSKVSNLRAAFEQSGAVNSAPRSLSITSNGRNGIDAEVLRLKEALAKEQDAREVDRQRIDVLEEEVETLRESLSRNQETVTVSAKDQQQQDEEQEEEQEEEPEHDEQEYDNDHDYDDQQQHDYVDAERLAEDLHITRSKLQAYEDEVAELRVQLNDMKRSIATNTRIENHEVADSAFQGELGTLCYLVQDWIVNTYRKAKVERSVDEMLNAVDSLDVEQQPLLKNLFERWDNTSKLVMLQSAAVSMMLPIFQDTLPFGLPANSTWSQAVRLASEELQTVLEPVAYNRWRATTFDVICHTDAISPFVHSAANQVTDSVAEMMHHVAGLETSEPQIDALRNIVRRMIALSHSLRVQRAPYVVAMPEPGAMYDNMTMEGVSGDHEESVDHTIMCAVFPAVYKMSPDANRVLLFKARVCWKESWL